MAKFSNESAASHVCAWYKNGQVIPLGFTYPSQEVKRDFDLATCFIYRPRICK